MNTAPNALTVESPVYRIGPLRDIIPPVFSDRGFRKNTLPAAATRHLDAPPLIAITEFG